MSKEYSSVLEKYKENLTEPGGVYCFKGKDPITQEKDVSIYVGKAESKLLRRITKHLKNDGGILALIFEDYSTLTGIDCYILKDEMIPDYLDMDIKKLEREKKKILKDLENYVRWTSNTFWTQKAFTNPNKPDTEEIKLKKTWPIIEKIIENPERIDLRDLKVSDEEMKFQQMFKYINSIPITQLIKLRRYKSFETIMEEFIASWENLKSSKLENYYWLRFKKSI